MLQKRVQTIFLLEANQKNAFSKALNNLTFLLPFIHHTFIHLAGTTRVNCLAQEHQPGIKPLLLQ